MHLLLSTTVLCFSVCACVRVERVCDSERERERERERKKKERNLVFLMLTSVGVGPVNLCSEQSSAFQSWFAVRYVIYITAPDLALFRITLQPMAG